MPTLENGGLKVTNDGKMVANYLLRRDVKWADGVPFTSRGLMFALTLARDKSMPFPDPSAIELMESGSAPDDYTFAVTWKQHYFFADSIGRTCSGPSPPTCSRTTTARW